MITVNQFAQPVLAENRMLLRKLEIQEDADTFNENSKKVYENCVNIANIAGKNAVKESATKLYEATVPPQFRWLLPPPNSELIIKAPLESPPSPPLQ